MATADHSLGLEKSVTRQRRDSYPADSRWFDRLSILTSAWFIFGLFLDGWAHNHIANLETFFTPWHGVLYSGFFSVAILMMVAQYRNVARGYAWSRALPHGYGLSLLGVAIFLVGGIGDMLWHEIFGIEQNLEALFSPTHLMLATGAFFFVSGPLRAAWQRKGGRGWGELLPAVLSVTMLFSMFTFFTQYANIFGNPAVLNTNIGGTRYFIEVTSVSYILIPAALMMGSILLVMRRWQLPFGSLTLMFVVNALVMLLMRFEFASPYWRTVVAAGIGGLFADILVLWLQPSAVRHNILRLFAFLVPFVYFLLVLGAIALTGPRGLWWEIHTWLGVPFVAGTIGVGLSFLVVSPPQPVE